ncbi:MAG: SBBP repeat-containing protein, partial [Deltaproteobacteria bacterium]|nr:SBBP repeat-containing protein [Deltaproteobacteria bacterium]
MDKMRNPLKRLGAFSIGLLILFAMGLTTPAPAASVTPPSLTKLPDKPSQSRKVLEKMMRLRIPFVENQGQIPDKNVRLYAKTFGGTAYVTGNGEMIYSFSKATVSKKPDSSPAKTVARKTWTVRETLVGASGLKPEGSDRAKTRVNYFIGNDKTRWKTGLPTFHAVNMGEVYKGINLSLKAYGKTVEKVFTIQPGADPNRIKRKMAGATSLGINDRGELEAQTGLGPVRFSRPIAYQVMKGKKKSVQVAYCLEKDTYGFSAGEYDRSRPLIIDPVLVYATFLGGSNSEKGKDIAVDSSGNAYVTGDTSSLDFPTQNPLQGSAGSQDAFVARIDPSGSSLLYSTYFGGTLDDYANAIAVDSSGNVYVTGSTRSSDFPTHNPIQLDSGGSDAFVTKINASGSSLIYSTYLGGNYGDSGMGIAVDGLGNAYVTGQVESTDFPTFFPGSTSIQNALNGSEPDAFVTKINATGTSLIYSTYLGGSQTDAVKDIAIDSSGNAYIVGFTESGDFPTQAPIQASFRGVYDAFLTKINPDASALAFSTYLGGTGTESAAGVAVDDLGNAYITGHTTSTDFPIFPMQSSLQGTNAGGTDVFVSKINTSTPSLPSLVYSTYIGGTLDDYAYGIAVDVQGNAYITGYTSSSDFPVYDRMQDDQTGIDAFVTKIDNSGSSFVYSTYLGGSDSEKALSIAVDNLGDAYITGYTGSSDFPTENPYQATLAGGSDAFVAKISDAPRMLNWFEVVVGDGHLFVDFDVMPGFRSLLTGASVNTPGQGTYGFDLNADKNTLWDSECRYLPHWIHDFGTVGSSDYGTYTLTLDFADGTQKVYTRTLQDVSVIPIASASVVVQINPDGSADLTWDRQD